ncbi:SDR family oxidoreductase [Umezawaea sp. Da 62-37]|uniref:SDR family oxidoreductase n=1 Tax=Umezawaea sp. Da 62-37 TaxID=3075927 RepID=UPI0037DD2118
MAAVAAKPGSANNEGGSSGASLCRSRRHSVTTKATMAAAPTPRAAAEIRLGRMAEPHEVAEVAAWLLSDRALIETGAIVPVDDGTGDCERALAPLWEGSDVHRPRAVASRPRPWS